MGRAPSPARAARRSASAPARCSDPERLRLCRAHELAGQGQRQRAVRDDAHRRAVGEAEAAHVEHRIVGARRAGADQHRVVGRAHQVRAPARGRPGDPAAVARARRDAPVERRRELQEQMRPAALEPREEARIHLARRIGQHAEADLDAGGAQRLDAAPRDARVGVDHRADDTADAGLDQRARAGGRAAVMRARLERDIGRGAAQRLGAMPPARMLERDRLGVRPAAWRGRAPADDPSVLDDYRADCGVRPGAPEAAPGEGEGALHPAPVVHLTLLPPWRAGAARRRSPRSRPPPGSCDRRWRSGHRRPCRCGRARP